MYVHPSAGLPSGIPLGPDHPNFIQEWMSLTRVYQTADSTVTFPSPRGGIPFPYESSAKLVIVAEDAYQDWARATPSKYFLVLGEDERFRSTASVVNAIWVSEDLDLDDFLARVEVEVITLGFSHPLAGRVRTWPASGWFEKGFTEAEKAIIVSTVTSRPSLVSVLTPSDPRGWVYRSTKGDDLFRRNLHKGQRKLFIGELDFLTQAWLRYPELRKRQVKVLYVGAAPGIHIPYLSKLFPNIRWVLVDPGFDRELKVPGKTHACFFASRSDSGDYPENTIYAEDVGEVDLMINDVRNIREEADYFAGEVEKFIEMDQADAIKWLRIVKPRYGASLKNRHPYGIKTARTIRGEVRMQAWAPQSSTETRNFIWVEEGEDPETRYYDEVKVDVAKYEDWCAYYNYCLRGWVEFGNPMGECGTCLDCAHEDFRWRTYASLNPQKARSPLEYSRELSRVIKQNLYAPDHPHGQDEGKLVVGRHKLYQRYAKGWKARSRRPTKK